MLADMSKRDRTTMWHLLAVHADYRTIRFSGSQLPQLSELLQPFNGLLATEGDDDTLINKPTGLCMTCAASGILTHTAFARKMYAKVNGPEGAMKHHHVCDVTKKKGTYMTFPADQSDVAVSLVGRVPRLPVIDMGLTSATVVNRA